MLLAILTYLGRSVTWWVSGYSDLPRTIIEKNNRIDAFINEPMAVMIISCTKLIMYLKSMMIIIIIIIIIIINVNGRNAYKT